MRTDIGITYTVLFYLCLRHQMRLGMNATRISDGSRLVLKRHLRVLTEEGPQAHELENNKLFSTEPLASNPRNHYAHLQVIIGLPDPFLVASI